VFAEPADHALGRSRGGLTSKLHLAVEQGQKPLAIIVTAGQRGDSPQFILVLEGIRVPRIRPDRVRGQGAHLSQEPRLPTQTRDQSDDVGERRVPLKAVAPVRIRSGLPSTISRTRLLACRNEGHGPRCVSDGARSGPAVRKHLCPIRARVPVRDGGLTAVQVVPAVD
jgi:hypothetical protein